MAKYETMNQPVLRAECKARGLTGYSNLTLAAMRELLRQDDKRKETAAAAERAKTEAAERSFKAKPLGLVKKAVDAHSGTGVKIEKDREERNGVKKPSVGGKCRAVWDMLDAMVKKGIEPKVRVAMDKGEAAGMNRTNVQIEFYLWRKFHGLNKGA